MNEQNDLLQDVAVLAVTDSMDNIDNRGGSSSGSEKRMILILIAWTLALALAAASGGSFVERILEAVKNHEMAVAIVALVLFNLGMLVVL